MTTNKYRLDDDDSRERKTEIERERKTVNGCFEVRIQNSCRLQSMSAVLHTA